MLGCESNRITLELLSSVFWVRSYSIKIKLVRYFIPVPVSVWNTLPAGPWSLFFDKKKKNQCRFNPTGHEYSDSNLHLIRNAEVDILYFSLLTLRRESRGLSSSLNGSVKPEGGTRERRKEREEAKEVMTLTKNRQWQAWEQRGEIILPCTRTSTMDFTSHCASFSAATMSIRMKMKIFATQIGFVLMKVISLGKKSRLIREMRIDSDCSATHSFFFSLPSPCPAPALPDESYCILQDAQVVVGIQRDRNVVELIPKGSLIRCLASHAKLFGFKNSQECLWVSFI